MAKKKALILSIIIVFIGLIITGVSYAFWSWNSNNSSIVFNTAKNLRNYITYDNGNGIFSGTLQVGDDYTDGIHTTISVSKSNEASSITLTGTIYMDVNAIGNNMKNSSALKWAVTSGGSSPVGTLLAEGNFMGANAGDTLTLYPSFTVTTTPQSYTIWIWLDESEHPSEALTGETLDTNVWTQIDQIEGTTEQFNVTQINANYQIITATAVNNMHNINGYAVTTSATAPGENDWTPIASPNKIFNLPPYDNTEVGVTYYVWFKDTEGHTASNHVTISASDTTPPSCTWGTFNPSSIGNGETATISLTCTDSGSGIVNSNITTGNITSNNSHLTVTNISKASTTNGYIYTITVTNSDYGNGNDSLTLAANTVKDGAKNGNASSPSGNITINNISVVTINAGNGISSITGTGLTYDSTTHKATGTFVTNSTINLSDLTIVYKNGYSGVNWQKINGQGTLSGTTYTVGKNTDELRLDATTLASPTCTISGGATKVYNYEATTLTATNSTSYDSGVTVAYQFGYTTTSSGTLGNYVDAANNTYEIAADAYRGRRYYGVIVTATGDGGLTATCTTASDSYTAMTLLNAEVNFDATTNGGTLAGTNPLYVTFGSSRIFVDNTYQIDRPVPEATLTNYSLVGWYTEASGGTMVIDDNGIVQPSVAGYTNANGEWILTSVSGTILYAQFTPGYYENVDTGNTYTSLSAAFSAVATGETIKALTGRTETANVTNAETGVTLDLNGKDIRMGTYYIINNGELDIYNSSSKSAMLTGSNTSATQGVIYNNGTLTTNNYDDTNNLTIQNTGTSYNSRVIYNMTGKEVTLNNNTLLTFTSANSSTNTSYSYYRSVINTLGTLYINGATITNTPGTRVNNIGIYIGNAAGRVVMSSGTLTARGYAIYNRSGTNTTTSAIDISGGSITSTGSSGIYNYTTGKINITGGSITGQSGLGIYSGSSALTMEDGTVTGSSYGIQSTTGALTITGGTITGSTYGIYKSGAGTLTLGNDDGNVSITNPAIYGGSNAINIPSGTWNYYDGVLYSTSAAYSNKGYTNIASGYLPIINTDEYGYKTYLGEPTYQATFYYNSNATSGSTTVASIKSGCITEEGSSTCDVAIPVTSSVGTYNNAYAGLATSTGTATATIPSTDSTITISADVTYYAIYSSPVTIYYPDTASTRSSEIAYRNQWFTSTSAMAATVLSTTNTGTTSDYTFTSSVSEYDLYGFATAASSITNTYAAVTNLMNSNATTVYAILYKVVTGTFYYYDGSAQATTTATANQYVRCTASAAETYNTNYTVPTVVTNSTGPGGNVYKGVSTVPSSTTTTTTINTSTTTYYAVYGGAFTASFVKENSNVSSIGSTSLPCSGYETTDGTTYSGSTCSITLPNITPASGYTALGWFSGLALIGQPNTTYILTSSATYTARAGTLEARNFYYDNTNTGVECNDVQCMIDYLDSGDQSNTTLSLGDYVSYTPSKTSYTTVKTYTGYTTTQTIKPNELNLWRVISLNDDGTVDIISEYVSSTTVYFGGQTGYQNFVGYLNVLASQYENSTYTVGSRHFGYSGQTLSITSNKYFVNPAPWTCSTGGACTPTPDHYEIYGGGDAGYLTDYDLVYDALNTRVAKKVGTSTATAYWMASRYYYYSSATYYGWSGRNVKTNGAVDNSLYLYRYNSSSFSASYYGNALRPIVTLKAGLTYTGSGTSSSPWVISSN